MHSALTTLIDRLESPAMNETDVIRWGAPVPSFGDLSNATVATVGLNPSNREFVDESGLEIEGTSRRFHTLKSLALGSWLDANTDHLQRILNACRVYFLVNPCDRWFKRLDILLNGIGATYYGGTGSACHLDLIPYATRRKWTDLTPRQRSLLLAIAGDTLALLLRDSNIRVLVLNGQSVVDHFQAVSGVHLQREVVPSWVLPRQHGSGVTGYGYQGIVTSLCGIELPQAIQVVGYNHNIQSSFGVSAVVILAIRHWMTEVLAESIQ